MSGIVEERPGRGQRRLPAVGQEAEAPLRGPAQEGHPVDLPTLRPELDAPAWVGQGLGLAVLADEEVRQQGHALLRAKRADAEISRVPPGRRLQVLGGAVHRVAGADDDEVTRLLLLA